MPTNWSSEIRRCEIKKLSSDDTITGGRGSGARDEVYEDEKVQGGNEVR